MAPSAQIDSTLNSGRLRGALLAWIDTYRGWELQTWLEQDGSGFWAPEYFARSDGRDVRLPVSRFCFGPTQARFEWLVDHFVEGDRQPHIAPWSSDEIDELIAIPRDLPALEAA